MKLLVTCMMIFLSPLLISAKPEVSDPGYTARYDAPEGTLFLSYSKKWDEKKLKKLHAELLRNTHGDEIHELTEVRVFAGECNEALGYYSVQDKSITLCEGNEYTKVQDVAGTLSHEYGHHVGFTYMPDHDSVTSDYTKLRTTKNDPVENSTIGELNTDPDHHKWYPEEIFADDYVQLYGTRQPKGNAEIHENDEIKPIQQLPKAQAYIAKMTGFPLHTKNDPHVFSVKEVTVDDQYLFYSITQDDRFVFNSMISLFAIEDGKKKEYDANPDSLYYGERDDASGVIISDQESIDLDELIKPTGLLDAYTNSIPEDFVGEIHVHVQAINPKTNTGFSIPVAIVSRDQNGEYTLQTKK